MNREPVKSSHIKSLGHDLATNTLEVEFQNGRVYSYPNTPRSSYLQILAMPSAGTAFHRVIKSKPNQGTEVK